MKQALFTLLFASFLIISCGDSVDCDANSFATDVNAEIDELNAAITAYSMDQSEDNCNKFKEAAENYLKKVEEYGDCTEINQSDYQQQLDAARDSLNQVPCN